MANMVSALLTSSCSLRPCLVMSELRTFWYAAWYCSALMALPTSMHSTSRRGLPRRIQLVTELECWSASYICSYSSKVRPSITSDGIVISFWERAVSARSVMLPPPTPGRCGTPRLRGASSWSMPPGRLRTDDRVRSPAPARLHYRWRAGSCERSRDRW